MTHYLGMGERRVRHAECDVCLQTQGNFHYGWCDEPGKCGGPLDGWGLSAEDIRIAQLELSLAIRRGGL
jgi:hypothetical protein